MNIPEKDLEYLYKESLTLDQLFYLKLNKYDIGGVEIGVVNWLNTPGPIYTTQTDNCGTGQPKALNNVGGDEDYYEFIFKQPFIKDELYSIISAANCDPFGGYFFDGNNYWTIEKITGWWGKVQHLIDYMVDRYDNELNLSDKPHSQLVKFGGEIKELHLYGPLNSIPGNYKSALDFYQYGLKVYLEWYIMVNCGLKIKLDPIAYNWSMKLKLDDKLIKRP